MKKILFYTDTPLLGGAENQMLLLARFLDKEKYEVILVCSHYEGLDPWVREWSLEGFKVYTLRVVHKHDPRHLLQLKKIIREEEPDLLHLHLWNPGACRYGFLAAGRGKRKIPIVVTEHDPFALRGVKNSIKKRNIKKTDAVIAISYENEEMLLGIWPEMEGKISTIHNGIDVTWFVSQLLSFTGDGRQKMREELFKADEEDKVILTVATLHERKGLKYLLEAAEMFGDSFVKFVIVGEGPQRRELEGVLKKKELSDRVILLGHQSNVAKIFKSADLFVLPSVKEAFGLVLLEAMASSLAVVATEAGGVPEIVVNGETGLLVSSQDALALKQAIERLLVDEGVARAYGEKGFERVKEKFDARVMAEKTAAVYEKVIGG